MIYIQCQLQIGTCHVPLQGLYHVLLQADFQHTTEWSSGWRAEMKHFVLWKAASQVVLVVKNPPVNAGDMRDVYLITGSGRSPGGGHDNLLLYSCLEATAHGVAKSRHN